MAGARRPLPQFDESDLEDRRVLIHKLRVLVRDLEQESGGGGLSEVTAEDIDSESATDGHVLTADGSGGSAFEALPASSGEANTTSNDGAGEGLAKAKDGVDLPFKSLTEGAGVKLTGSADEVQIAAQDTRVDHGTETTGTVTLDYNAGRVHEVTVGGDITLAVSNWPASGTPAYMEVIVYDADAHTLTLPSWTWTGGSEPTFGDHERWILRTDDGGTSVDAMQAFSSAFDGSAVNMQDNELIRPKIKDYGETLNAIGSVGGGTQDIDFETGNVHSLTVDTSETTLTLSNPPASGTAGSLTLYITNGGSQTFNWPASVDFGDAGEPSLQANGLDIVILTTLDGGTSYEGMHAYTRDDS